MNGIVGPSKSATYCYIYEAVLATHALICGEDNRSHSNSAKLLINYAPKWLRYLCKALTDNVFDKGISERKFDAVHADVGLSVNTMLPGLSYRNKKALCGDFCPFFRPSSSTATKPSVRFFTTFGTGVLC